MKTQVINSNNAAVHSNAGNSVQFKIISDSCWIPYDLTASDSWQFAGYRRPNGSVEWSSTIVPNAGRVRTIDEIPDGIGGFFLFVLR